jgi:hypothetical protein
MLLCVVVLAKKLGLVICDLLDQARTCTIVCSGSATGRSVFESGRRLIQSRSLGDHLMHLRIQNSMRLIDKRIVALLINVLYLLYLV